MDRQGSDSKMLGFAFMMGFIILGLVNLAGIAYCIATVLLSTMPNGPWVSIITVVILVANGLAMGMQAAHELRRTKAQQGRRALPAGSWFAPNMAHVFLLLATVYYFLWACEMLFTCSEHLQHFASIASYVTLAAECLLVLNICARPVYRFEPTRTRIWQKPVLEKEAPESAAGEELRK